MENLIEKIEEKIIEAENCCDIEISEEYLKGYINGLKISMLLIKEEG